MVKHYFKMSIRKLRKNLFYTLISIIGLSIAMGAFVILTNYASFESNYDSFQKDKDKIYRAEAYFTCNGTVTDSWATSAFGYAPAMKTAFPEVKAITRISNHDYERMVRYKNVIYREPRVVLADSNFFSFFSYPLIKGDAKNILKEPNTIAISASSAKKYFGNENPIGKILEISTYQNSFNYAVSGVFADFPPQSHLHLNLIISYSSATPFLQNTWYIHEAYTYVKTANVADAQSIEKKFPQLAEKYKTADVMRDKTWGIKMVPLTEIHLNPIKPYEFELKGSRQNVQFLFLFGMIILVVGWVNFINIMTSNAIERAGEIGIRKVAGANTGHLIVQFIWESLLINFAAVILFLFAAFTFLPVLEHLYGTELFYRFWKQPLVWELILSTFLFGTLITGAIPVLILKDVKTAIVLKNNMAFKSGMGNGLRQGLIIFQYSAAIILTVATITIRKQMNFMQSHNLGIEVDQTMVFKTPTKTSNYDEKLKTLVQHLKTVSGVKAVTLSSAVPGKMVGYGMANHRENDPQKISKLCEMLRVDYEFLKAYNLHLIKGRNFSASFATDTSAAVILTENAMHLFGFKNEEDAVNSYVSLEGQGNQKFKVIGVVQDYHQMSLKENFRPIVLLMFNPWAGLNYQFTSIKINGSSFKTIMQQVNQEYKTAFPESSFDAFFLNDFFNDQYQQDRRYSSIMIVFTWLTIIIVCLGILGISSLMLLKRTKEIAIRKISGASVLQILQLINRDFIKWIIISFIIGTPAAWLVMTNWLQNFPYRTSIDWWVFLLAVSITLLITLVTVSFQAVKAALANPVKSLRSE